MHNVYCLKEGITGKALLLYALKSSVHIITAESSKRTLPFIIGKQYGRAGKTLPGKYNDVFDQTGQCEKMLRIIPTLEVYSTGYRTEPSMRTRWSTSSRGIMLPSFSVL